MININTVSFNFFNRLKIIPHFIHKAFNYFKLGLRKIIPYFIVLTLVFSLIFVYFWPQIIITINSGNAGVLYKRFFGTVTDKVFPEGMHAIYPWDKMYIYNVRIQTVLHEFSILTNKGLPIHISLAVRFHPEYEMLGILHKHVGPDYIETIIIPQVESVLRKRLSLYDPEDIYVNKGNILTKVIIEALEQLGRKYITTKGIIIRSIKLPESVSNAIEDKLVQQQLEQAYTYLIKKEKREAERKRIEAQGITDYQSIISQTLSEKLIKWQGVQATLELAKSNNAKIVIIGSGENGLPIILGNDNSPVITKNSEITDNKSSSELKIVNPSKNITNKTADNIEEILEIDASNPNTSTETQKNNASK